MNKSVYLAGILAAFLLAGTVAAVVPAFAEENGEREAGEREQGESGDDSEGGAIDGVSGLVLYGVIAAVLGTIGYTAYKIFAGRKKTTVSTRP